MPEPGQTRLTDRDPANRTVTLRVMTRTVSKGPDKREGPRSVYESAALFETRR